MNILNDIYNSTELQSIMDWCEPVFYFNLNFFNDPLYDQQYYLKNTGKTGGKWGIDINVEPAWNITKGSSNIRIAVVDQGVEAHEDLGTLLPGYTVGGGNGSPQNADKNDLKAHGEACAGIISALHNNIGIRGVAPDCKIVPVNIVPYFSTHIDPAIQTATSFASNEDIATALNWAWHNADVLSCSWGGGTPSSYITSAIDSAITYGRSGKGCILVFSSGNKRPYSDVFSPANVTGVISVGAINNKGNVWDYSCRGNALSVVAPSGNTDLKGDVATIDRMGANGYETGNYTTRFGGTSAACPQVAGIAALILSVRPDLTQTQVRNAIESTCRKLSGYTFTNNFVHPNGTWNSEVGYGLVNAYDAVNSVAPKITGASEFCFGQSKTYTVTNAPNGFTWNKSSNLTLIDSGNSVTVSATSPGSGWISINSGLTELIRYDISIPSSAPVFNYINGPEWVTPGSSSYSYYSSFSGGTPTSYMWNIYGAPSNWYIYHEYNSSLDICFLQEASFDFYVTAYNACGCDNGHMYVNAFYNKKQSYNTYPNPASTLLTIEIAQKAIAETPSKQTLNDVILLKTEPTYDIRLYNGHGHLLRHATSKGGSVQFDVSHLHNGTYYLHVNDGVSDKPEIRQIIVKH